MACRFFCFLLLLFLTHELAVSLFRVMGTIGRNLVVAYTVAWLLFLLLLMLGGFILTKRVPCCVVLHGVAACNQPVMGWPPGVWFLHV